MTIVLQNKFWELVIGTDAFSVGLSFNQIPAKLHVPFSAITAFVDPAVDFGLQFQAMAADEGDADHDPDNDGTERDAASRITSAEDGSNVVSVDFGKKK
jgi:hypothetical protein